MRDRSAPVPWVAIARDDARVGSTFRVFYEDDMVLTAQEDIKAGDRVTVDGYTGLGVKVPPREVEFVSGWAVQASQWIGRTAARIVLRIHGR